MGFMDYRLRMLLEQCELANNSGQLTNAMLSGVIRETLAYKEPAASDIRMVLAGLSPEKTSRAELQMRLRQAQRILNLNADYN